MYLCYVDESGKVSYNDPSNPIFVLCGFCVHESNWENIESESIKLKAGVFATDHLPSVEFKAMEIKSALNQKVRGKGPYLGLSMESAARLRDGVCALYKPGKTTILGVAIDKAAMVARYSDPWHVYDVAYGILSLQVCLFLESMKCTDKVMIVADQMSEVQKRVPDLVARAKNFANLWTRKIDLSRIVEKPFFADSKSHNCIQLADVAAYTVYRAITRPDEDFSQNIFWQAVHPCFHRDDGSGCVYRHGLKCYPEKVTREGEPVATWARFSAL